MEKLRVEEIYNDMSEYASKHFDEEAKNVTKLEPSKFIHMGSITIHSRRIGDWGREEDTDVHIVLDEFGNWLKYTTIIQAGAGDPKMMHSYIEALSLEELIDIMDSQTEAWRDKFVDTVELKLWF